MFIAICLWLVANPALLNAQQVEYVHIQLSHTVEYKETIKGPNGSKMSVYRLLGTTFDLDTAKNNQTPSKIQFIVPAEDGQKMLDHSEPIWIAYSRRVAKDGDWIASDDPTKSYILAYAWGKILNWSAKNRPTNEEIKRFAYLRLEHTIKWVVHPKKIKDKSYKSGFYQTLGHKVSGDGKNLSFTPVVAYLPVADQNDKFFTSSTAQFIDYAPMIVEKGKLIEPESATSKNKDDYLYNIIFNFGDIGKVIYVSPFENSKSDPFRDLRKK